MTKGLTIGSFITIIASAGIAGIVATTPVEAKGNELSGTKTCPDGGEWTKIDSGNLSQYPVKGADEYCFKAGNWPTVDTIPEGGFGQEGSCNNGIQFCGLSHWAYRRSTPVPTPYYNGGGEDVSGEIDAQNILLKVMGGGLLVTALGLGYSGLKRNNYFTKQ